MIDYQDYPSLTLTALMMEQVRRREEQLRTYIQAAKRKRILTPAVVAAFAALHIVDDDDMPIVPAAHHWLWLQLLCDWRIRRLLIVAPPESAKTTWITAFLGTFIGFYPELNIIVASASGDVAERRSMALRVMTESEAFNLTFPSIARAGGLKWDSMAWSVAEDGEPRPGRLHPTLSAYGTGGAITGSRANLSVGDDILDFENTRTDHQRKTVRKWVHNSFLTRLKSRTGRAIFIGTAWTHDDAYAEMRKGGRYVVCHTPLLSESEQVFATLTYPDDWPYERIGEPIGRDGALLGSVA